MLKRKFAAVVLAAGLAVGGAAGIVTTAVNSADDSTTTEEALRLRKWRRSSTFTFTTADSDVSNSNGGTWS